MHPVSVSRRRWLAAFAGLFLICGIARAAPPVVEIIAFAHPPVQSALKPLRDWLTTQGSRVKGVEIDVDYFHRRTRNRLT